jgi:predicted nucleotidyltransferase
MDRIVQYLREKYRPRALLVYGSYVRGDQDGFSDFDCMVIVDSKEKNHDDSVVDGVQLDCYIFTADEVSGEDVDPYITAYDSRIVFDDGIGASLKERVRKYVAEHTVTEESEKEFIRSWIRKILRRMEKDDDEGSYRGILFLSESLEDYCALRDLFSFGSKKTIAYLKANDPQGYALFHDTVTSRTDESIRAWAEYAAGH